MAYTPPDNDDINFVLKSEYTPPYYDDIKFLMDAELKWANSIKLTIDNTNIDSDLTHFPIPIVLGTSVGQSNQDVSEIFDALVYPYRPESVDDDFTGNDDDSPNPNLWALDGSPVIDSNKLQMEGSDFSKVTSIYSLTGDFDVRVDLDVIVGPSTDSWSLGLGVWWENTDFVMMARRYSTGQRYESLRRISGSFTTISTATTSDTICKFKITRSGSTLSFFKWGGSSWDAYGIYTGSTDAVQIFLEHGGWSGNPSFTGDFDNFVVNSGTIVWNEAEDHFTGADDDLPNPDLWTLAHDTGTEPDSDSTMSIQSNALLIDINAEESYPFVTSIFQLSGDFDVQVDIDPQVALSGIERVGFCIGQDNTAPISGTGDWAGIYWQDATNVHHRTYNVNNTGTSPSFPTIGRFVRSGSTLTLYSWNGTSWISYASDSSFGTEKMYVRMFARTTASGTFDTVFDNFTVNSGSIVWSENTNPNRRKIAITQDDKFTQLYGEIELWDSENKKAVIWASSKDLILSNSATTDLYLYYDSTKENNDNYIGDTSAQNIVTNIEGDTFAGVDEDSPNTDLWEVQQNDNSYLAIRSNKLNFSSPGTDINVFGKVRSVFTLFEDFDIQIDWDSTTLDAPDADVTYAARLMLKRQSDDQWVSAVSRIRTSAATSYASQGTDASEATFATTDTLGKFRAVRSSGVITIYIWSGTQWEWNGSTSGRQVDGSETGDLYVFFEFEQENNGALDSNIDNFIINSGTVKLAPSHNVWDENYKAVYHMSQDPSGGTDCILDSTININHGTPGGTMLTEDLVDGDIGKAIDFDGTDDYIGVPNDFGSADDFTVEVKVNFANRTLDNSFIGIGFKYSNDAGKLIQLASNSDGYKVYSGNQHINSNIEDTALRWVYIVMTCASNVSNLYKDLTQIITNYSETLATWETTTLIGTEASGSSKSLIGKIAEVRLSESIRPAAWLKAAHYALKDNLITFDIVADRATVTPIMMIIFT